MRRIPFEKESLLKPAFLFIIHFIIALFIVILLCITFA
jgi:hypothetical protein